MAGAAGAEDIKARAGAGSRRGAVDTVAARPVGKVVVGTVTRVWAVEIVGGSGRVGRRREGLGIGCFWVDLFELDDGGIHIIAHAGIQVSGR